MTFQREERYTVLKITDVGQALDADECEALIHYEQKVAAWRENNGKRPLVAVVVESDWPEYEPTWAAIEQRMTGRALPSHAELERDAELGMAAGFVWSYACTLLDKGVDIRTYEMPKMFSDLIDAINKERAARANEAPRQEVGR